MAAETIWALALNSTRARVLRGVRKGPATDADELELCSRHRDLREIMADKPGRSFSSASAGRRSSMEYGSDPIHEDERAFAKEVVELLETHRKAGDFDRLAIFASPEMLGIIRPELTDALRKLISAEVPKNLMHETEAGLMQIVADELFGA